MDAKKAIYVIIAESLNIFKFAYEIMNREVEEEEQLLSIRKRRT